VFGPLRPELDAGLPQLAGPETAAAAMLEELALGRTALEPIGLAPVGLEMSARGGVRLALSSGASVELGRDEHEQRLQRFTTAWPRVPTPPGMELGRADLRYANGFAIEWRAVPPPPAPPPPAPRSNHAPTEPAPTEPAATASPPRTSPDPRATERMNRKSDKALLVGLDIGTSKIVAIVGEYAPGEPVEVIGIGSHPRRA
jgi:hypothetical protein